MSVITNIVLVLIGVAVLLFIGFTISCILQIRQTVKDMTQTLRILNENLPVIMKNLEEITTRVNHTTATVQGQFEDLSQMIKKVKGALFLLVGLEEIIQRRVHLPIVPTLRTFFAVSKGVSVFLSHLLGKRPKDG